MVPIRILHVVGKMHYGGMETLIMNIFRNIDRKKVIFDFLVHYDTPGDYDQEIIDLGGKIYVMPRTVPKNYFLYKSKLKKFFKKHTEYKIIHGHLISTSFIYNKISKKYSPRIAISHSHNSAMLDKVSAHYTTRMSQKSTDIFFGCSNEACKYSFPDAIKSNKEMIIIKNSIDSQKYIYNKEIRDSIRLKYNIGTEFVVGHVARLTEAKNQMFLLEIFKSISKLNKKSKLLIVGKGEMENKIKDKIKELDLQQNVIMTGAIPDVHNILQAMDVLVLPSKSEGFGIVLIEAQANSLMCFTSKDRVPYETKISEYIKYISLEESASNWADHILKYSKPYNRKNMNQAVIDSGYDIKNQAKWLQEFYIRQYNTLNSKE